MKHYETVFILTPVLSDEQMKDAAEKFKTVLQEAGAEVYHEENWGLKKLAFPINKKSTGFYHLFEYKAAETVPSKLEIEFRRDERVMRFLTVILDKYGVEFNENRRAGKYVRKPKPISETEAKFVDTEID
jgi:small subunit ribosomal protein S6